MQILKRTEDKSSIYPDQEKEKKKTQSNLWKAAANYHR